MKGYNPDIVPRRSFRTPLDVPVTDGKLALGTWQQIVFIDFENRSRRRKIVAQVMGE